MNTQTQPYEIIYKQLQLLDLDSIVNLCKTNKHMNVICNDVHVQKLILSKMKNTREYFFWNFDFCGNRPEDKRDYFIYNPKNSPEIFYLSLLAKIQMDSVGFPYGVYGELPDIQMGWYTVEWNILQYFHLVKNVWFFDYWTFYNNVFVKQLRDSIYSMETIFFINGGIYNFIGS
jgi:hypothetical protein